MEGERGRTRMRHSLRVCRKIGSAKIKRKAGKNKRENDTCKQNTNIKKGRKENESYLRKKKQFDITQITLLLSFLCFASFFPHSLSPFLSASISLPSWWLYQFASSCCSQIKMDASPCATVETHLQLSACAINLKPGEFSSLLYFLTLVSVVFVVFPTPILSSTPSILHQFR